MFLDFLSVELLLTPKLLADYLNLLSTHSFTSNVLGKFRLPAHVVARTFQAGAQLLWAPLHHQPCLHQGPPFISDSCCTFCFLYLLTPPSWVDSSAGWSTSSSSFLSEGVGGECWEGLHTWKCFLGHQTGWRMLGWRASPV